MIRYTKNQTETPDDGSATFTVEKNTAVEDQDENNPETQIRFFVTNNISIEKTKVVVKIYHTNPSIHFQRGKRIGIVTSTSVFADCLEKHRSDHIKDNGVNIEETNLLLKTMVITSGVTTTACTSSGDQILNCEHCSFRCFLKHQLNMHRISKHGVLVKPLK